MIAGGTCPTCGAAFDSAQARNLHYMRRHADRRRRPTIERTAPMNRARLFFAVLVIGLTVWLALAIRLALAGEPADPTDQRSVGHAILCVGAPEWARGFAADTTGGFWVETQAGPSYRPIDDSTGYAVLPPAGYAWWLPTEDSDRFGDGYWYDCRYSPDGGSAPPTVPASTPEQNIGTPATWPPAAPALPNTAMEH